MRIRKPFLAGFATLAVFAGYIGLAPNLVPSLGYTHSDKLLHFITFFLFAVTFYWSFETSRRRAIQLTLILIGGAMSVSSEVIQGLIPNGREFDYLDIVGNCAGSLAGVALCSIYHKRMLERKRAAKGFASIPGDEESGEAGLELDEGTGAQETGVTVAGAREAEVDLDEDLDHWDENAADEWDEEEGKDSKVVDGNGKV